MFDTANKSSEIAKKISHHASVMRGTSWQTETILSDFRQSFDGSRVPDVLLTTTAAAGRLGISVPTLYDWLGQSDHGLLIIRGEPVSIAYFQGGPRGQGRILLETAEIERIRELMRVQPERNAPRQRPIRRENFPGISVPLGRPNR
jgi:hypothetical protein